MTKAEIQLFNGREMPASVYPDGWLDPERNSINLNECAVYAEFKGAGYYGYRNTECIYQGEGFNGEVPRNPSGSDCKTAKVKNGRGSLNVRIYA